VSERASIAGLPFATGVPSVAESSGRPYDVSFRQQSYANSRPCPSYCRSQAKDQTTQWTASIQLLVRDDRGVPISGLSAADFTLTEHGAQDIIVEVRNLSQLLSDQTPPEAKPSKASFGPALQAMHGAPPQETWVLFVLAPMSAAGRRSAIKGLLKSLEQPKTGGWHIAMLDDEGEFTAFGQSLDSLGSRLERLAKHVSAPQFIEDPWVGLANRAIEELAIRPGEEDSDRPKDLPES